MILKLVTSENPGTTEGPIQGLQTQEMSFSDFKALLRSRRRRTIKPKHASLPENVTALANRRTPK